MCAKLISVNQFTRDNNCSPSFTPYYYVAKDLLSQNTLFKGINKGGLYPLQCHVHSSATSPTTSNALSCIKILVTTLHRRLGHPSFHIMIKVCRNLLLHVSLHEPLCCNDCKLAKIHKQPFMLSSSVSSAHLQLLHIWMYGVLHILYLSMITDFMLI